MIGFILTIELDWPAFFNPIYRKNCILTKTTPVYIIRKDTEGLISTIKEYYYYIGEEKTGPYDLCYRPSFSPDGKTLAYTAKIDGELQSILMYEGNKYIGSICNNSIIYFSNNQIFIE